MLLLYGAEKNGSNDTSQPTTAHILEHCALEALSVPFLMPHFDPMPTLQGQSCYSLLCSCGNRGSEKLVICPNSSPLKVTWCPPAVYSPSHSSPGHRTRHDIYAALRADKMHRGSSRSVRHKGGVPGTLTLWRRIPKAWELAGEGLAHESANLCGF